MFLQLNLNIHLGMDWFAIYHIATVAYSKQPINLIPNKNFYRDNGILFVAVVLK